MYIALAFWYRCALREAWHVRRTPAGAVAARTSNEAYVTELFGVGLYMRMQGLAIVPRHLARALYSKNTCRSDTIRYHSRVDNALERIIRSVRCNIWVPAPQASGSNRDLKEFTSVHPYSYCLS